MNSFNFIKASAAWSFFFPEGSLRYYLKSYGGFRRKVNITLQKQLEKLSALMPALGALSLISNVCAETHF